VNGSNSVAKVDLRVQPGDELEVSAEVAAQLERTALRPVKAKKAAEPVKKAAKKAAPPADG